MRAGRALLPQLAIGVSDCTVVGTEIWELADGVSVSLALIGGVEYRDSSEASRAEWMSALLFRVSAAVEFEHFICHT